MRIKLTLFLTMMAVLLFGMSCYAPELGLRKYRTVSGHEFMGYYQLATMATEPGISYTKKATYRGTIGRYYVIDCYDMGTGDFYKYQYSPRTGITNLKLCE